MTHLVVPPTVTFCGAARTVTGSMHLVQVGPYKLLLDCGLYLGREGDDRLRAGRVPFHPSDIDAVILSHAHIDHCGNLPEMVHLGFSGPIYCTGATRDLLPIMLADSARIQLEEEEASDEAHPGEVPTLTDVQKTVRQCVRVPYDQPTAINDAVEITLLDAGHVLGSAIIALRLRWEGREWRLTFTGDLGRPGFPFLRPPSPLPPADLVVSECTYGGKRHQPSGAMARVMAEAVQRSLREGGKLLIPAFSLGRAQVVAHYLQHWMMDGLVPQLPVYVDSPMVADIIEVYRKHPDCLSPESVAEFSAGHILEKVPIHYVRDWQESRDLTLTRGPAVIVASGGMLDGGRALYHLQNYIDDPRATIVLVSYQAAGSLGRRLLERGPTVQFLGRKWNKWAEVVDLNGFSGHADHDDLLRALRPLSGQTRIELVHGDLPQAEALRLALLESGFAHVDITTQGRTVPVERQG